EGKKTTSCSSRLLRVEEHSPVTASTEPGDSGRRLPGLRRPRVEPQRCHLLALSIRECKKSALSRNMVTMRTREWLIGLMLVFVSTGQAVGIASLQATSATVAAPGADADLCVVLDSHGERVAGTQNDLVWDPSCATLASPGDCRVDSATGKS